MKFRFLSFFFFLYFSFFTQIISESERESENDGYYENYWNHHAPKEFVSTYERKFALYWGKESDGFGRSVDIYENTMIVGACFDDTLGSQAGSAHIYTLTNSIQGWKYITELWVNDTNSYDYYGWDVAITSKIAAVGAWQHDSQGYQNNGAVYIYEYEYIQSNHQYKWNITSKLMGFNHEQYFGISLSFSKINDILYIGAAGTTYNSVEETENIGAVYIAIKSLTLNRWMIITTLYPIDGGRYDYYGISVSIDYLTGVVGAYGHNSGKGEGAGAAYVYKCESSDDYYYDYSSWYLETRLLPSDSQKK